MLYLLPLWSYLAGSKSVSAGQTNGWIVSVVSDLDTITNSAQEATASSSGKYCLTWSIDKWCLVQFWTSHLAKQLKTRLCFDFAVDWSRDQPIDTRRQTTTTAVASNKLNFRDVHASHCCERCRSPSVVCNAQQWRQSLTRPLLDVVAHRQLRSRNSRCFLDRMDMSLMSFWPPLTSSSSSGGRCRTATYWMRTTEELFENHN